MPKKPSRQSQIVKAVFFDRFEKGETSVFFSRQDLFDACTKHDIEPLKNMGDGALYSYRYRTKLPKEILETQPEGKEWVILGRGISQYEFRLVSASNILPNENLLSTKIPIDTICSIPSARWKSTQSENQIEPKPIYRYVSSEPNTFSRPSISLSILRSANFAGRTE